MSDHPTCADGIDRGYPVETPVGTMYLRHVGWGVLVDNSSNTYPHREGRPYLHIGDKEFTATVGVYPDGNIERAYVHKRETFDDAAPSYTKKIVDAARVAALAFIEEHPEAVAAGEHYRMASVTRKGDVVTLTLTTAEALYVAAELGGGNAHWHGLNVMEEDSGPYSALVDTLKVGGDHRGPLAKQFSKHRRVAAAARPTYDMEEGRKASEREGFLVAEPV